MSVIEYTLFPKTDYEVDFWMMPDLNSSIHDFLDIFDPVDLSRVASRLDWLNRPECLRGGLQQQQYQQAAKKFRIAVDIRGINKNSVKTNVTDDNKLIITAKEGKII